MAKRKYKRKYKCYGCEERCKYDVHYYYVIDGEISCFPQKWIYGCPDDSSVRICGGKGCKKGEMYFCPVIGLNAVTEYRDEFGTMIKTGYPVADGNLADAKIKAVELANHIATTTCYLSKFNRAKNQLWIARTIKADKIK